MREIKFRAWDTWYDKYFKNTENVFISASGRVAMYTDTGAPDYGGFDEYQKRFLLEQYTGLKDKNGVEIYENDIIEISDTSYGDSQNHYGVVKYSEYAELVVGNILLSRIYNAIKVIGNVHENADLLEEQS